MKYTKTTWQHELDDLPMIYYSKFDDNGKEICRIDVYRSGKTLYADEQNQEFVDDIWLSDISFDEVMSSDLDDEMMSIEISQNEFNQYWCVANNPHFNPKS
ncbi:MAG: hypothetical protein Q3971_03500 [Moraxella sp.]|nr:hypothetical protein [Moraxella sp.]